MLTWSANVLLHPGPTPLAFGVPSHLTRLVPAG